MPIVDIRLARTVRLIAGTIAVIVAVALPLVYWLVVYGFTAEATSRDAATHADLMTERINADPDLWRFEIPRMDAIIAAQSVADGKPEKHYILDERGVVLAQGAQRLSPPILTRSAPLFDSGTVVGRFVTSRSLVPQLQDTALIALFGLALALAIYVSLSVLPLRALTHTLGALDQERTALRNSTAQLRLFSDNVPAMAVALDESLHYVFANRSYAAFFGIEPADVVGRHLSEIVGEATYREIEGHFAEVLQGHPVTYHRIHELQNGESRYLEIKLLPHIEEYGKVLGCFSLMTDITEYKLTEERIQRIAHHDTLTGLPNRALFNDRLDQAIRVAKRDSRQFALLFLDLDKFKRVNDTLGHNAGDELLQAVAARIQHQVRESDTVARIGGDEFTVILRNITRRENAEIVARKIIAAVAMPFQLGSQKQSVDIGTSIGIAVYPSDAQDADALIDAADAAMYSAKQTGSSSRFCAA